MARITEIEAHDIYPEYHDFNALYLARAHGWKIQGRTIFVMKTDEGLEGLGESWGPGVSTHVASDAGAPVPESMRLYQNHPNPFNPSTTIRFDWPTCAAPRCSGWNATSSIG